MARKPETVFSGRVNKALEAQSPGLYCEKTNNPYRAGIPDFYYDPAAGLHDFWIEFKWYDPLPPQIDLCKKPEPKLTSLQQRWLERAYANGRFVFVAVGFSTRSRERRGVVFSDPDAWHTRWARGYFCELSMSIDELVENVLGQLPGTPTR